MMNMINLVVFGIALPSTLAELAVWVVIIAAVVAIVFVALRVFKVEIPQWVIHIFWIVVVAFVAIFAIRLVSQM